MKLGVAMARARFGGGLPFPLVSGDEHSLSYEEDSGDEDTRREYVRHLRGVSGGDAVRHEASRAADVGRDPSAPEIPGMLAPNHEGGVRLGKKVLPNA